MLFVLVGTSLLITGTVYLTADQFMSYHADALEIGWNELARNQQGLILGFLRGLGSGAFIAGAAIVVMAAASFTSGAEPYRFLLPLIAVGYPVLLCFATYTVYTTTPGDPPLLPNIALVAVGAAASFLFTLSLRGSNPG